MNAAPVMPPPMRTAAPARAPAGAETAPDATAWGQWWLSRYGPILIEVRGGVVFVNGQPVEPAPPPPR